MKTAEGGGGRSFPVLAFPTREKLFRLCLSTARPVRLSVPLAARAGSLPQRAIIFFMSFCDHCEGQRFDRARVLRTLRQLHKELRETDRCAGEAVNAALHAIRSMDIPHLDFVDEVDEVVH